MGLPATALAAPVPTESPWTLDRLGRPALAFVAYGVRAGQGSKDVWIDRRTGRIRMKESSAAAVKAFREAIREAATAAAGPGWVPLDGPLVADAVITYPRGSAPLSEVWPWRSVDLDKALRASGDAIAPEVVAVARRRHRVGGVIADDSRIVAYRRCEKVYAGAPDPDALRRPGIVVRLWPVPDEVVQDYRQRAREQRAAARRASKVVL